MKYFGNMKTLIKNRRLQLNLKLKDLAAQMQIDSTLLSRFESGARIPTKAQVSLLAAMLDLPEDQLMMLWLRDRILADYGQEVSLPKALQLVQDSISEYSNLDPTPAASKSLLALLDRLDAMQQQWSSNRHLMHQKVLGALMMEYTFESNRIEGNTLTLQETDLVVQHGLTVSGKSMREHLEAINHHDAIDFVKELATDKKPISERDILQIHSLVLRGIDPNEAGRYRRHPVIITGAKHIPPAPEHLREHLDGYFVWYRSQFNKLHPVLMAADIHAKFVTIHPFIDGNGRTSRLLMNLHLLQHGYPIGIIKGDVRNRMKYYKALDESRFANSDAAFREFMLQRLKGDLERYLKLVIA